MALLLQKVLHFSFRNIFLERFEHVFLIIFLVLYQILFFRVVFILIGVVVGAQEVKGVVYGLGQASARQNLVLSRIIVQTPRIQGQRNISAIILRGQARGVSGRQSVYLPPWRIIHIALIEKVVLILLFSFVD